MTVYGPDFFAAIDAGCRSSAAVVVPIVQNHVEAHTVIDVGCGTGHWAKAFEMLGCQVTGVDGPETQSILDTFVPRDLGLSLRAAKLGEFDLAVSLEVAEHLPQSRAEGFIDDLCALAPVVLFSAAIPGQGGNNHVNERHIGYWVDHFERCGYTVSGALRWMIWRDERVESWYAQNMLLATIYPGRFPELFNTPMAEPFPVVHPTLWNAYRG